MLIRKFAGYCKRAESIRDTCSRDPALINFNIQEEESSYHVAVDKVVSACTKPQQGIGGEDGERVANIAQNYSQRASDRMDYLQTLSHHINL